MMTPWRKSNARPHITVYLDNNTPQEEKVFHCLVCGEICFGYFNDVRIIMAGKPELGFQHAPLEIECTRRVRDDDGKSRSCKTMYLVTS